MYDLSKQLEMISKMVDKEMKKDLVDVVKLNNLLDAQKKVLECIEMAGYIDKLKKKIFSSSKKGFTDFVKSSREKSPVPFD